MGDLGVAELDQVARCGLGNPGVVDPDGRGPGQRSTDPDNGPVDREELLDFGRAEFQGDRDHRIHPLAEQKVVQHALPALLPHTDVVQREIVPGVE
ncbi:hypothetical protein BJQ89_03524 [Arthrobacter sp. ES1]|nr:hypothetical protein [Arthrobacter sp. ES1]